MEDASLKTAAAFARPSTARMRTAGFVSVFSAFASASRVSGVGGICASASAAFLRTPGFLSVSSVRLAYDDGRPGFRLNDLGLDLTLTAGPLALSGLFFVREGERRLPGALLNLAYDDARAGLVEFRAEFPTVTYRIVCSEWSYLGAEAREWLLQPAVVWTPVKWIEATIEYLVRRLREPGRRVSEDAFRLGLWLRF
jgi:hypothetical protein